MKSSHYTWEAACDKSSHESSVRVTHRFSFVETHFQELNLEALKSKSWHSSWALAPCELRTDSSRKSQSRGGCLNVPLFAMGPHYSWSSPMERHPLTQVWFFKNYFPCYRSIGIGIPPSTPPSSLHVIPVPTVFPTLLQQYSSSATITSSTLCCLTVSWHCTYRQW